MIKTVTPPKSREVYQVTCTTFNCEAVLEYTFVDFVNGQLFCPWCENVIDTKNATKTSKVQIPK